MSNKNSSFKKEDKLMIFVTGIPSKTTPEVVLNHFRQFGTVELYKLGTSKKAFRVLSNNPSTNTRRGFCLLQARDVITFNNIISSSSVKFQGRSLAVSKFRQGSELYLHNEYINSRRIVVKKVPADTCPDAFRSQLETAFGVITRMYKYEAESAQKAAKKEKTRVNNTYSVEFEEVATAEIATIDPYFYLQGVSSPVIVERYQKKSQSAQSSLDPKNNKVQTKIPYNELANKKYIDRIANLVTSDQWSPNTNLIYAKQHPKVRKPSQDAVVMDHCIKPTTYKYKLSRSLNTELIRNPIQNMIRFNIRSTRHQAIDQRQPALPQDLDAQRASRYYLNTYCLI